MQHPQLLVTFSWSIILIFILWLSFSAYFVSSVASMIVLNCIYQTQLSQTDKTPKYLSAVYISTFFISFEKKYFIEIIQWKRVVGVQELEWIFCVKVAAFKKNHERSLWRSIRRSSVRRAQPAGGLLWGKESWHTGRTGRVWCLEVKMKY